jgi:hypothetical protein
MQLPDAAHRHGGAYTRMRTTVKGLKPSVMTKLRTLSGVQEVISFIEIKGMLRTRD